MLDTPHNTNDHDRHSDSKRLKWLVYTVFAIGTIQTILVAVDSYHWFASGYGDMREMGAPLISPFDVPILDGLLAFIVQHSACVAMASLGGALSDGIGGFQLASLAELNTLIIQTCFWLAGGALADALIAVIMTWLLLRERSRSQSPQTGTLLVKIVRLTVETNTLTAAIAFGALVCLLAVNGPNSTASVVSVMSSGNWYSDTLMAVLNNRLYLRGKSMAEWHHSSSDRDTGTSAIQFVGGRPTSGTEDHPNWEVKLLLTYHFEWKCYKRRMSFMTARERSLR
ncbi:hypothetical protein FPV67DRAFT_1780867 [Lyophyllum atratum]|nr:hypothetical protein FPV67DRAFT_1780867 [Lyophyllum atratum]